MTVEPDDFWKSGIFRIDLWIGEKQRYRIIDRVVRYDSELFYVKW